MSISTKKDYIDILAQTINLYQKGFNEVCSETNLKLLGTEVEIDLAKFFPDIRTIDDVEYGIDSDPFLHSLTASEFSFESYGLKTVQKGGRIYFESSELIIKEIVTLLGVFTRKKLDYLLHVSDIKFQKGMTASQKKIVFKYGKLLDVTHIKEEHLTVIKRVMKNESPCTEVHNLMLSLYVS
jgi:hypothetical protein